MTLAEAVRPASDRKWLVYVCGGECGDHSREKKGWINDVDDKGSIHMDASIDDPIHERTPYP